MFIFKHEKGRDDIIKQLDAIGAEIIAKQNKYLNTNKDCIEAAINRFLADNQSTITTTDKDKAYNRIYNSFRYYTIRKSGIDTVIWELFNNYSVMDWDASDKLKRNVAHSFIDSFKDLPPIDFSKELSQYDSLDKQADALSAEVAYWRKYYDLNHHILTELTFPKDDGNCEYLPLSKANMLSILDFIDADHDSTQVQDILDNWDDTATYVYHPWW